MRPRNDLVFTLGLLEIEQIVFENKPPRAWRHVLMGSAGWEQN